MAEETNNQGNINLEFNTANAGLNTDQSVNQIAKGSLTYALNATVENFDANSINYQNEPGNEFCCQFPTGYRLIGTHFIVEQNKQIFFLVNPNTNLSQIGYMDNADCVYKIYVQAACLNFNINNPIHKVVHKITNCTTEIYWTDGFNPRRYLDLNNIPYILAPGADLCDPLYLNELDCNQLKVQPNFSIPDIEITDIQTGGSLISGTYQFAIQYADAVGNPYTSYYSVTNPTPIADTRITTLNFNYEVGKSIVMNVTNLDVTGQFQYFNIAVIKTINNISSVELIGTYFINEANRTITYTGQNVTQTRLTINDIFEKYPYYDIAQDLTTAQDILIWDNLTSIDRINYQSIASGITLGWETYRIPANENYSDELNATNLRGYLRDEVYAFEIVFLLRNGKQTDGFHIPGRIKGPAENLKPDIPNTNPDFIGEPEYTAGGVGYSPWWKIYNTGSVTGFSPQYNSADIGYKGPYQYGEFAYWESSELYPCNKDLWGDLADQPIRHHKFPDVLVSTPFESKLFTSASSMVIGNDAVYPIGVRVDVQQISQLITSSNLTSDQKADIYGFKIVRGDRGTNKSIVAKGILRNVGSYKREEQTFYYPNYPYNDLREDPFLNVNNNAFALISSTWLVICIESGKYQYTDPNTNKRVEADMVAGQTYEFCSVDKPAFLTGKANIGPAEYDVFNVSGCNGCKGYHGIWDDPFSDVNAGFTPRIKWVDGFSNLSGCGREFAVVGVGGNVGEDCQNRWSTVCRCRPSITFVAAVTQGLGVVDFTQSRRSTLGCGKETPLTAISAQPASKYRHVFNSPETSFGTPFLGKILKLENVIYGGGKSHFVEVRNNAKYKLLTEEAQRDALNSATDVGNITDPFNAVAMFSAYQAYLTIYVNGITRKNYAYSYNSTLSYDYSAIIDNNLGIKQRELDIAQYITPSVVSVGDNYNINNWYRETSVYLKTADTRFGNAYTALPFPSDTPSLVVSGNSVITDNSRTTISASNVCNAPAKEQDINSVCYYGALKNIFINQWGQIYSYDTIDTGFQRRLNTTSSEIATVFGGDTFISRFAFKTKLPFFIDNRVGAPDDSDIFYDEIGNIAYPKYWHSSRSILEDFTVEGKVLSNIISYKAHNFDCPNDPSLIAPPNAGAGRTFYDGYFYLFAYGIPNFYCESSYNTDLRQAFNNREGDFWPHVSTGIPDDWVQESFVTIAQDNTYHYNVTYSKQNKENFFSHLPADWETQLCFTNYPFRAIYSDPQNQNADNRVNNWLSYRATAMFDFPQNYGKLTSLDGIQNKAVLARFENKSLLYNTMLTVQTSNPQAAYLGNDTLFKAAPPIDFAETDLGYVGSQNKMLLKIPQGQVTVDAKRGQVFLIAGNQATDLSAHGSGMNRFLTDNLSFQILKYFPNVDVDNHFNGLGLHGVYDSKYDRIILTHIDYVPLTDDVKYDEVTKEFYVEDLINNVPIRTIIYVNDTEFFCNKSWTLSYNLNTRSWISFHSYIPNWYIAENNFFYSGINGCCDELDANSTFGIFAGDIDRTVTTTTTITTLAPVTTTTTSTIGLDCELVGVAATTDCVLDGVAIITVPATTTTTICQRPMPLNGYTLYTGYTLGGDPPVVSTGSFEDACAAIALTSSVITVLDGLLGYASSLSVGELVYDDSLPNCTYVPDGWYFTQEGQYSGFAYYIEGGFIRSIDYCECGTTTSTTTLPLTVPECCGIVFNNSTGIYYLNDDSTLTQLPLSTYTSSFGIAMTATKLWAINTQINEWDITTNPFTSTFARDVAFPVGFTTASGIVAIDNLTLIGVDSSVTPQAVTELDITGLTAVGTVAFTLQADRIAIGNMLYTLSGKLLVINQDTVSSDFYLTQYNYSTGAVEVDDNLGTVAAQSVFECDCNIFIMDTSGDLYVVDKSAGYTLVPTISTGFAPLSATQIGSCVPTSLTDNANLITTTTTTTVPVCFCYTVEVSGDCNISWVSCPGVENTQNVSNDILVICAQENSVSAECDLGGTVTISGGTSSCTVDGDC